MATVGVRELRQRASELLRRVEAGETIEVTDRGRPVAVLAPLPERATAWGTVFFGLEAPDRLQLVQSSDATALMPKIPPAQRAALAPDYLVLGYPELRDSVPRRAFLWSTTVGTSPKPRLFREIPASRRDTFPPGPARFPLQTAAAVV